jgi:hypothetical protein
MKTLREFIDVYRAYRAAQSRRYALITAWNIAVRGWPF